jgi:MIP family channel proteins
VNMATVRRYLAEFIGTFALVFVGTMVVAVSAQKLGGTAPNLLLIAFGHGLILMAMIYALGAISGAHFNPAITIAVAALRKLSLQDALGYIIAQLVGAAIAVLLHALILNEGDTSYGLTLPAPEISDGSALLIEAILTFFLATAVIGTAVSGKAPAGFHGLAIGLTLTVSILVGGTLTGASLNPARTFGPAIVSGDFSHHWVYWAGPILGSMVAAMAAWLLYFRDQQITN